VAKPELLPELGQLLSADRPLSLSMILEEDPTIEQAAFPITDELLSDS
jgi:hypothetical protein